VKEGKWLICIILVEDAAMRKGCASAEEVPEDESESGAFEKRLLLIVSKRFMTGGDPFQFRR